MWDYVEREQENIDGLVDDIVDQVIMFHHENHDFDFERTFAAIVELYDEFGCKWPLPLTTIRAMVKRAFDAHINSA